METEQYLFNQQVIKLDDKDIIKLKEDAKNKKILYHYTSIDGLKEILLSKALKANKITNVYSEKIAVIKDIENLIYILSLTYQQNNAIMWENFGDHNKGAKIIIDLNKHDFVEDIIDNHRSIDAYDINKNLIYNFAKLIGNGITSSPKSQDITNYEQIKKSNEGEYIDYIGTQLEFLSVDYISSINEIKRNSIVKIEDKEYLIINKTAIMIRGKYDYQKELRLVAILRATSNVNMKKIHYILIPIDFNNAKIKIEFGKYTSPEDKKKINKLIKDRNLSVHIC